jgi:thiosulfate reductase cytochrome b subunit
MRGQGEGKGDETGGISKKVYLFKVYERIWHWVQSGLILGLLWTGFALHGTLGWPGFETAIEWHEVFGICLLVLTVFTMFWHVTTGEGRQFIPKTGGLADMIRFYTGGIFRSEPHPTVPTPEAKFNALQRFSYFSLLVFVFPVQMLTGFILWALPRIEAFSVLRPHVGLLALVHTAGAFGMLSFIVVHLYMITTGPTLWSNLKSMFTGYADEHGGTP